MARRQLGEKPPEHANRDAAEAEYGKVSPMKPSL